MADEQRARPRRGDIADIVRWRKAVLKARLPASAQHVAETILSHGEGGEVQLTVPEIAKETGRRETTIRYAIRRLVAHALISRIARGGGKGQKRQEGNVLEPRFPAEGEAPHVRARDGPTKREPRLAAA